jgi:hypothetical protein
MRFENSVRRACMAGHGSAYAYRWRFVIGAVAVGRRLDAARQRLPPSGTARPR